MNIPNTTLTQLLEGDLVGSCYTCNGICVDENNANGAMSNCQIEACPSHTCWFLASQNSPRNLSNCGNQWAFSSGCRQSADEAQVDMTLMYYIRTRMTVLNEMEAVCRNENCNNFTVFKQLKDAIRVNPNLNCLSNIDNGTTIGSTMYSGSSTSSGTARTSITTPGRTSTTTTGRPTGTGTTGGPAGTTTTRGSAGSSTTGGPAGTNTTRGPVGTGTTASGGTTATVTTTTTAATDGRIALKRDLALIIFLFSIFYSIF